MALISCPECKKEVSDKAVACIHCGYPLSKSPLNTETIRTVFPDDKSVFPDNRTVFSENKTVFSDDMTVLPDPETARTAFSQPELSAPEPTAPESSAPENTDKSMLKVFVPIFIFSAIIIGIILFANSNTQQASRSTPSATSTPTPTPKTLTETDIENFERDLRLFIIDYDEIDKQYAIQGLVSRETAFATQVNVSSDGKRLGFPMRVRYVGNGWIFFDEIIFAFGDERITKSIKSYDKYTETIGGSRVIESYTFSTSDAVDIARSISGKNNVSIRLRGDKTEDLEINTYDVTRMLRIYDMLKEFPELVKYVAEKAR